MIVFIQSFHLFKVNCVWSAWRNIGSCSSKCGTGTRTKTRTKVTAEANGGICHGKSSERVPCKDCSGKICFVVHFSKNDNVQAVRNGALS